MALASAAHAAKGEADSALVVAASSTSAPPLDVCNSSSPAGRFSEGPLLLAAEDSESGRSLLSHVSRDRYCRLIAFASILKINI